MSAARVGQFIYRHVDTQWARQSMTHFSAAPSSRCLCILSLCLCLCLCLSFTISFSVSVSLCLSLSIRLSYVFDSPTTMAWHISPCFHYVQYVYIYVSIFTFSLNSSMGFFSWIPHTPPCSADDPGKHYSTWDIPEYSVYWFTVSSPVATRPAQPPGMVNGPCLYKSVNE